MIILIINTKINLIDYFQIILMENDSMGWYIYYNKVEKIFPHFSASLFTIKENIINLSK